MRFNIFEHCRKNWLQILQLSTWVTLIGIGFGQLIIYSNTPGLAAKPPSRWPDQSKLSRGMDQPTLVIFAHPHCPCSKATLGELARLLPSIQQKIKILVVFFKSENKSESWIKENLWQEAQSIPGVEAVLDETAAEAKKFDANTSGQTFLYDSSGELVFNGGLTPARGHMGDSDGRSLILQFLTTGQRPRVTTPVYGCSLRKPERIFAGDFK